MTCREKLRMGHPGLVDDELGAKGIPGCPHSLGLMPEPEYCPFGKPGISYEAKRKACEECWNREIPETEQEPTTEPTDKTSSIPSMTDLQWLMRKALGYPGVAVSITFMEDAITFNAYPYPTREEPEGENE